MENELSESDLYDSGEELEPQTNVQVEEDENESKDEGTEVSDEESSSEGEDKEEKKIKEAKFKTFEEKYFEVDNDPPKLVVVQGPPKSGKTTLIRSLVRHYTKQTITDPRGPITVRTGKRQRITIVECPQDATSMMDLSSIADVVLLTIDSSIGFEMQTFEFLSMLQIKGFPKWMGIMTHMDLYKDNKKLKKMKKFFKKRFDEETTQESKLFFTKGFKSKYYLHSDVINMARFLSVIMPRKLEWKKENPHILVDRIEMLTDGVVRDEDFVEVALFGYTRGGTFKQRDRVNLVGLGKKTIKELK